MGFHRMQEFNRALLAKWVWNLMKGSNSLCLYVLRARYLLYTKFQHASLSNGYSPFWKSILSTKDLMLYGACFTIGNGESINLWDDPWVPMLIGFKPTRKCGPTAGLLTIKDMIL